MLSDSNEWVRMVEVNPPTLPNMSHVLLDGVWERVLVTDNVFGKIRVSPFAYAARVTHDVPSVKPTVVVSTRDRNILAIESEVRGALGNGVGSFLVVIGDTYPHVDHLADHYEIVSHLRDLHEQLPTFEVGMPTRFREWQFRKRIEAGAEFFVAGPILDPATVGPNVEKIGRTDDDPPLHLMVIPPTSLGWIDQMERIGAVPASDELRKRLADADAEEAREVSWEMAAKIESEARDAGCSGVILMGMKYDTVVGEAAQRWRPKVTRN